MRRRRRILTVVAEGGSFWGGRIQAFLFQLNLFFNAGGFIFFFLFFFVIFFFIRLHWVSSV